LKNTARGVSFNALLNYRNANIASFALGIFYLLFPWFSSQHLNETVGIFGLMFLTISVMRAKKSNTVLGGLFQAFIGVIYLFALVGLVNINILWFLAIALTIGFFILELGFVKVGPITPHADAFQIVPFTLLTFGLLISMMGYSTLFVIPWSQNMLVSLNYIAVFMFSLLSMLQLAGWEVAKKGTNTWILAFAAIAIITAVIGTYSGTLFQWT
jgi:hypothetical protein